MEIKEPFYHSKRWAKEYGCDLCVTNGVRTGIGNVLMFTPLVEAMAREIGRPIKLLTGSFDPKVGVVENESHFPVWDNNPYVGEIFQPKDEIEKIMEDATSEVDDGSHSGHIINNICKGYGLKPYSKVPVVFLTKNEMQGALNRLAGLRRPVICLHPYGTTSSVRGTYWFEEGWNDLIEKNRDECSFIQLGFKGDVKKNISAHYFDTSVREAWSLIWASDLFIGFDSSHGHMAASFGKPSVIIWDTIRKLCEEEKYKQGFSAAVLNRWGYKENKNVMIFPETRVESLNDIQDCIDVFKIVRRV